MDPAHKAVMNRRVGLQIAVLTLAAHSVFCQYGYNYEANYYDDYSLYTAGGFPPSASKVPCYEALRM